MLRNFGIRKMRLSFPTRLDQWITGPLDVILMSIANMRSSGSRSKETIRATIRSKARFVQVTGILQNARLFSVRFLYRKRRKVFRLNQELFKRLSPDGAPQSPLFLFCMLSSRVSRPPDSAGQSHWKSGFELVKNEIWRILCFSGLPCSCAHLD